MLLMLETLIFNGSLQNSQDRYSDFSGHFDTSYNQLQPFFTEFLKVKHFAYFNFLQKYEIF